MPAPGRFSGELTGAFTSQPDVRKLAGSAAMPQLSITDAAPGGEPFLLENLKLLAPPFSPQPELTLTADPLDLQAPRRPLTVSARFFPRGWAAAAAGGAALPNLQALAAALHSPALDRFSPAADGTPRLQLALNFEGGWVDSGPSISGTVSGAAVRWQPAWLPFPVDLVSADASLASGLLRWQLHAADAGPLHLSGTAQTPLLCDPASPCITRFALQTPLLDAGALQSALTGSRPELVQSLLRRFQSQAHLPAFLGTIHADTLLLGPLPMQDAQASLSSGVDPNLPENASISLNALHGSALGGTVQLQGALSLAGTLPAYRMHAALVHISAPQAAAIFGEAWPPGVISGSADFTLSGVSAGSLTASLAGNWQASWLNGSLGRSFATWDAAGSFTPFGLQIARGALAPSADAVTGTIGWDRSLHLRLTPPEGIPATVKGSLAHPVLEVH